MRWLVICFLLVLPWPVAAADRVALVIGVSDYRSIPPLKNTANDATALSAVLDDIGFQVTTLINASGSDMRAALDTFAFEAETADLALVYFAGHGVEVQGENFLIPADAQVTSNADIQKEALSLNDLLAAVDRARKMRIVILDSCRDNPFGDFIDLSKPVQSTASDVATRGAGGLAPPAPDRGTLVAFAAKDGNVALDGNGNNSPFALALMDKMKQEGLEISLMFRQVRDDVLSRTGNRQEPHTYGSLSGIPFFLAGAGDLPAQVNADDPKLAWSALRPEDEAQFIKLAEARYPVDDEPGLHATESARSTL
ncbi:caspase domain-containing protein [Sulfitobacter porphyrae]|uniref:Caspase domain-containing protein n=1 Tax=Sulfitobacter porphyrae TaxID=1246864 RepID=A0ABW2BAU6_9RHOB